MKKKVLKKQNASRFCLVCGFGNDAGLHTEFYELEDGTLAALAQGCGHHQSFPGRIHGGIVSALLDETIGRAIQISEPETWAVTAELQVRFKKPVPCDTPLLLTGRVVENNRRLFTGQGELYLPDGSVAATGVGRYRKLPLSSIADFDSTEDSWENRPREDDPTEIEIPEKNR